MELKKNIDKFIERGISMEKSCKIAYDRDVTLKVIPFTMNGPEFEKWKDELYLFVKRKLVSHELCDDILDEIQSWKNGWVFSLDKIIGMLQTISDDNHFMITLQSNDDLKEIVSVPIHNDVFIVHGHDEEALSKAENFVRKMGLNPIILKDQASQGMTVIEKIENRTDVGFAIVLYTPCDNMADGQYRARQNVVFEHGFLIAKLSRKRVAALVKGKVEILSDMAGVVYISMDTGKEWERELAKELRAAGYDSADANKI